MAVLRHPPAVTALQTAAMHDPRAVGRGSFASPRPSVLAQDDRERQSALAQRGAVHGAAGAGIGGDRRPPIAFGTRRRMRRTVWGMLKSRPVAGLIAPTPEGAACRGAEPDNTTRSTRVLRRVRMDVASPAGRRWPCGD
jgi:hypothetical protein